MKEIEEDTKRWKTIPCSWITRVNIVKMSLLPRAIYTFNAVPIKIPPVFYEELEQIIKKFVWNQKKPESLRKCLKIRIKLGASPYLISSFNTKL